MSTKLGREGTPQTRHDFVPVTRKAQFGLDDDVDGTSFLSKRKRLEASIAGLAVIMQYHPGKLLNPGPGKLLNPGPCVLT